MRRTISGCSALLSFERSGTNIYFNNNKKKKNSSRVFWTQRLRQRCQIDCFVFVFVAESLVNRWMNQRPCAFRKVKFVVVWFVQWSSSLAARSVHSFVGTKKKNKKKTVDRKTGRRMVGNAKKKHKKPKKNTKKSKKTSGGRSRNNILLPLVFFQVRLRSFALFFSRFFS